MPVKYTKEPVHPVDLIPHDFDFGRVIEQATGDDASTAKPWPRFYDQGMKDFLKCVWAIKGRTVPVVKASPMNAFGEYKDFMIREGLLAKTSEGSYCSCPKGDGKPNPDPRLVFDPEQLNQFPLPYVSFHDHEHRPRTGNCANYPIRNMRFVDTLDSKTNEAMRGVTYMRYPKSYWVPFQVEVWAKHENHLKWMVDTLESKFWDHYAFHWIEHPHPTPRKANTGFLMPIKMIGSKNNTDLERGEDEEKIMRWTFTLDVEAWAFYDELMAPTVQILEQELIENVTEEEIGHTTERLTDLAPTPLSQQDPNLEAPEEPVE